MNKSFKITIIIVLVLIVVFGYWQYSSKNETADGNKNETQDSKKLGEESKIISTLERLKKIEINADFFNDNVLKSLSDFSRELIPEPVGRMNPFLSVESYATTTGR